ncbi:nuclear transport factor 2 family protein [Cognatishimia sp. MH4019]|uniref:nuclear transport factor 2 family protein n=1 Tax=Cognatishimia sp. MH4019 TaxID=2854030 RepID=UPI001CD55D1E|nr:nuclear transport factor 2 family protein [Cognatishimia sp. MH4019]
MIRTADVLTRRHLLQAATALVCAPAFGWAEDAATPEALVAELVAAMAENDGARMEPLFAQNASQAYGSGRVRSGDAFRSWLQSDIINANGRVENAALAVDGNTVVVTGRYRNANGYSSDADFLFTVEGNQITNWIVR